MSHIFDDVEDWFRRRDQLRRYPDPQTPPAPEAPVSLLDTIRGEFGRLTTLTEDDVRKFLPSVAKAADDAEALASSEAAQTVLSAVLPPEAEALIVGLVKQLDQRADEGVQNLHAGEQLPSDTEPEQPGGEPPLAAAGPVVGGTAR